jgi:hypothetical protein
MPDDARNLPIVEPTRHRSILRDPTRFEFTQRVARLYSESKLVPAHLQGKLADCFIALQMADAMDEDPLMVMQNIFIINAKAGWSAQYMIARANRSGNFRGPLRWRTEGVADDLAVTCYADLAHVDEGDTRVEVTVSMAMAKADGWTRNEKYKSIPEQMLRWRSATWLIRLYCPEVMMGLPAAEEVEDTWGDHLTDVTPPRPELADFQTESEAPRTTRRGSRRAAATTEDAKAGATPPTAPEKWFFSDEVGEVFEFEEVEEAFTIYGQRLEAAKGNHELLEATWDNGARLLSALRNRGHGDMADALNHAHGQLLDEIVAAENAADAAKHAAGSEPGAGASATGQPATTQPSTTAAQPAAGQVPPPATSDFDVAVPWPDGMAGNMWHQNATAKLREMRKEGCPKEAFTRFGKINSAGIDQLRHKAQLPSWAKLLEQDIAKSAAAAS